MRGKSGFTLIELLVVIAIIAILAAILFPVFTRARAQGQMASCGSNLKQIAFAVMQYGSDNSGAVPLNSVYNSKYGTWSEGNSSFRANNPTYQCLRQYLKNDSIYLCPAGPLACDYYVDSAGNRTRYEIDYRFNDCMTYNKQNPTTRRDYLFVNRLDTCTRPKEFYVVSDRHTNHHLDGQGSRNVTAMPTAVMLMVMVDGHLASNVRPYNSDSSYKDSKGQLKYSHWDFPNCHPSDVYVQSEY